MKEPGVLADHGDAGADLGQAQLAQVTAPDRHPPALGIVEAQQQAGDGRLAGAARPHDAHALARAHREAHAGVGGPPTAGVHERHALEGEPGVARLQPGRAIVHGRARVEDREDPARRRQTQHPLVEEHAKLAQRAEDLDAQHQDDEERRQ